MDKRANEKAWNKAILKAEQEAARKKEEAARRRKNRKR
jgi:hypothetical protein